MTAIDWEELYTTLTHAIYKPPENSLFEGDLFIQIISCLRVRNKVRIVRDLWLYITPSAEHLNLRRLSKTLYLREEI